MKILAIDPGTTRSGVVLYDSHLREVGYALVTDNEEVLRLIQRDEIAERMAIEMVANYGMAVGADVHHTVLWAGRFFQRWLDVCRGPVPPKPRLVYRMEVKIHLCHNAKAKDANIRAAIIDKFGPGKDKAVGLKRKPGPLYGVRSHCWPALGVALVAAETEPA